MLIDAGHRCGLENHAWCCCAKDVRVQRVPAHGDPISSDAIQGIPNHLEDLGIGLTVEADLRQASIG